MLGFLRAEEQRLGSFVVAIHRQRILTTYGSEWDLHGWWLRRGFTREIDCLLLESFVQPQPSASLS
jgi:hypothetical protein